MQHGRSEAANQQFQHVRKSRDAPANAAVGHLFMQARREKEAIPYLERAASLDPLDANILLDLAYVLTFDHADLSRASAELANAERAATLSGDEELLPEIHTARQTLASMMTATSSGRRSATRWR
jgi:hypothetical protein